MRGGKKKEASKGKQTNKAKQHSTHKAVTFPKKNELPQVYMGVLCCFALFVCLTLLASFFLPSHISFKNMYMYMYNYCVVRKRPG